VRAEALAARVAATAALEEERERYQKAAVALMRVQCGHLRAAHHYKVVFEVDELVLLADDMAAVDAFARHVAEQIFFHHRLRHDKAK